MEAGRVHHGRGLERDRRAQNPPVLESERRAASLEIVEERFAEAEARRQGSRCLRCNVNTVFDTSICVACNGCVDVCHPILVSYLAAQYKRSKALETLVCAAILHDTVEDTSATYLEILRRFGMPITCLVFELTSNRRPSVRLGKLEYLKAKMKGYSSYALFLKLCARLANLMDNPSSKQLDETVTLLKYLHQPQAYQEPLVSHR